MKPVTSNHLPTDTALSPTSSKLTRNLRSHVEVPQCKFVASAQKSPHLQHLGLLHSALQGQHHKTVMCAPHHPDSAVKIQENILLLLSPVLSLTHITHSLQSQHRQNTSNIPHNSQSEHTATKNMGNQHLILGLFNNSIQVQRSLSTWSAGNEVQYTAVIMAYRDMPLHFCGQKENIMQSFSQDSQQSNKQCD
jgi:hypothetical protein